MRKNAPPDAIALARQKLVERGLVQTATPRSLEAAAKPPRPEKVPRKVHDKTYNDKHKDQRHSYNRDYYRKHRDKLLEYGRKWRAEHPDYQAEHRKKKEQQ